MKTTTFKSIGKSEIITVISNAGNTMIDCLSLSLKKDAKDGLYVEYHGKIISTQYLEKFNGYAIFV